MCQTVNKEILRLAIPAILTNITVPLLGMVDSAITGHLGSTAYIGAITIGSMTFNLMYWLFAFLRMGTSGLTSQALGRGDGSEVRSLLRRSLRVAILLAALLLLCQWPIREVAFLLLGAKGEVLQHAYTYFNIVIWGAPASLGLFALTGWYIGMQNSRIPMWVAIVQNVTNIVASLILVYTFHLSMRGVAIGTVIAQWTGFLFACSRIPAVLEINNLDKVNAGRIVNDEGRQRRHGSFFAINRDIFLRTLCLVSVNLAFTAYGARQGEVMLAVNGLLMQLFLLFSYFIDGFAFAGEAMSGKAIGAGQHAMFWRLVRRLFVWGLAIALPFTLLYALLTPQFITLLTDQTVVSNAAKSYVPYIALVPLLGMPAFIWDGIYIGATASRQMLITSIIATLSFFAVLALGAGDNPSLWIAFLIYLSVRGLMQTWLKKTLWQTKK